MKNWHVFDALSENEVECMTERGHSEKMEYTKEMEHEYRSVRKWNHDMENHLFSLNYLIREKKYHEADSYLETIFSELPPEKRTL